MFMMAKMAGMMVGESGPAGLKPQDVFAADLATGTGATQRITNAIDLLTYGGLVWEKSRSAIGSNILTDTVRGVSNFLVTDSTAAQGTAALVVPTFFANGYQGSAFGSGTTKVGWSFRQAAKFFDVVTYTGTGVSGLQVPHSLGVAPGMIVVKCITSGVWVVYHRIHGATKYLTLNSATALATSSEMWNDTTPTANYFTLGSGFGSSVNASGSPFVAYLFAHDPDPSGIVQCGSLTADGSGNATVNLGWRPQFAIIKATSASGPWYMLDTVRGWAAGNDAVLQAHLSNAEAAVNLGEPTASGFTASSLQASASYVFLAIREPI